MQTTNSLSIPNWNHTNNAVGSYPSPNNSATIIDITKQKRVSAHKAPLSFALSFINTIIKIIYFIFTTKHTVMKRLFLFCLTCVLSLTIFAENVSESISGNYNGSLLVGEETLGKSNILLTAEDENHVTFTLKDFKMGGSTIGNIVLKGIPVEKNGEKITFGTNEAQKIEGLEMEGIVIKATAQINSNDSFIANNKANIKVNFVWYNGDTPYPITISFEGTKEEPKHITDAIKGTYKGEADMVSMLSSTKDTWKTTLELRPTDETHATVVLTDIIIMGTNLGSFILPKIGVIEKEGQVTFDKNEPVNIKKSNGGYDMDFTVNINTEMSVIKNREATIVLNVNYMFQDLPITFKGTWLNGTTRITQVKNTLKDDIYNLHGHKVKGIKHGLYIQHGKLMRR